MQSVTVLTPSGHRHTVKVEPNKTVLWILEQTCDKYKLTVDDFDLKHHNKVLDLSLMFRFAGIPNNANLEMLSVVNKRVEQEVTICLQLDDGSRQNGQFPSSTSLRGILEKLSPDKLTDGTQHLVVIYMRSEYHGAALDTTTLRIMGLSSGGRALLRLIHANPDSLKVQANVSANLPQKPREPSPERATKSTSQVAKEKKVGAINIADEIKKIKQVEKSEDVKKDVKVDEKVIEINSDPVVDLTNSSSDPNQMEVDDESDPEPEPIVNILDDRGTIIFSLDSMKTSSVDVADSFFNLTESEVRLLYRDLKQQVEQNESRPLMTAALRKLEENKKVLNQLAVYKTCIVRIQFPNRYVIQSKFSTVETVGVVVEFVRKFLVNADIEFHLFTTPPKQILDPKETLIESNCVPSALLHFGCDEKAENILIKDEFLQKLSSGSGAKKVLGSSKSQVDQDENAAAAGGSSSSPSSAKPSVPKNFMASKAAAPSSTGTVPQWFKLGK